MTMLRKLRLRRAGVLLQAGALTLDEIAKEVGFPAAAAYRALWNAPKASTARRACVVSSDHLDAAQCFRDTMRIAALKMFQVLRTDYDAVQSGQARLPLANRPSAAGMKVALVERGLVGGTCVNTGCTPMTRVARAVEKAETRGYMRLFVDPDG